MTAVLGIQPGLLEVTPRVAHRRGVTRAGGPIEVSEASLVALVDAVRGGSEPAFRALYDRFHRAVHAVALARLPASEAADVVQEVFMSAWQKIEQLDEPAAFPGWLLTMARRRVIDHARRPRAAGFEVGDLAVEPTPRAEAVAALAAIRALPEAYRETLIMRLVEGMTGPEIAERTGLTADSVRVNLHRGMKLLRERLEGGAP